MDRAGLREQGERRWRYWHVVAVFGAGIGASLVASIIVLSASGGVDVNAGTVEISNEWLFWFVLPAQLLGYYVVLRWVSRRNGTGSFADDFGFEVNPTDWAWVAAALPLVIASAGVVIVLQSVLGAAEESPQSLVNLVAGQGAGITAFAMVAGIGILGPILEELMFRGLLFDTIRQRNSVSAAVIGSSVAFSLPHLVGFDWSGAGGTAEAIRLVAPPLIVLFGVGLVLSLVKVRTRSLSAPILLHSGFNVIQVMVLLFAPDLGV